MPSSRSNCKMTHKFNLKNISQTFRTISFGKQVTNKRRFYHSSLNRIVGHYFLNQNKSTLELEEHSRNSPSLNPRRKIKTCLFGGISSVRQNFFPYSFYCCFMSGTSQLISFELLMATYFNKEEDEYDLQTSIQYLRRRGLSLVANNP
jgi:hypothetical protein